MRCQQVLSGAANNGNNTVARCSFNGVGYTVYCTGCDIVVLDDVFHRVQLITNISGCRSQITAITLCPSSGRIGAVSSHSVYILSAAPTVGDDEYPYLWKLSHTLSIGSRVACATFNNDGSELIVTGSELLIYRTSDWKCSWSAHVTEETTQVTVSPDGRFFTTLSRNSRVLKLWKKMKDGREYRSELILHPDIVIGACWRSVSPELPKDSVRQVLLTSCHDCIGRIWLEAPSVHPSISARHSVTKSFVLGTVLDPLKESTEKRIKGSPYIFQWFNNKALSYSVCLENARLKGELILSEGLSVSSYDIAEEEDFVLPDSGEPAEPVDKEMLELKMGKVKDMREYQYTESQLLKYWYKSFDMVVCVSPATGSFMGWRVEKIDVAYPFQALTTRFVLKLPWSLSYADARQLKPTFTIFSSRKVTSNSVKDRPVLRNANHNSSRQSTDVIPELEGTLVDLRSITLPSMSLLTAHFDGTVNLFSFEMGVEDVTFTDMGNLVHEVRCSGHRCPPILSLSHPYIPLVLTTSSETGSPTGPGYGELILWRVSCIGPMTTRKTGILELARVDTKRAADFTAVAWFPKAFSVIPQDAKNHAGVLTSFVLHFVAFTGHSLELYRVVTLSESLHTAKMILDKTSRKDSLIHECISENFTEDVDYYSSSYDSNSCSGEFVGEEHLCSKSSGSGASKIYHVGRITDVEGECAFLHTFPLAAIKSDEITEQQGSLENLEEYHVIMVDKSAGKNNILSVQVSISNEEEPGAIIEDPAKVQPVHNTFFCARWGSATAQPLPLPLSTTVLQCSPAAATVATPKFVPPGTRSPYLFSALCSDSVLRFFALSDDTWITWPEPPLRGTELKLECDVRNTYTCNSIPGRLAVAEVRADLLVVSMFESESSGGACWTLEDSLELKSGKTTGPVLMDFMSAANGTHLLAIVQHDNMWILTPCSCISLHSSGSGLLTHQPSKKIESWVSLLRVQLNSNGPAEPRSLSWNSTGSLLLGINTELQLFSPWYTREEVNMLDRHSHLERGVGNVYNDALSLQPRLPQYHPYVLRQLIDNRKVTEVKLILHYLFRYLVSYYRSSKLRAKTESNIISIIPPLPLHDLNNLHPNLFAETDSVNDDTAQGDYSALFTTAAHLDDSDDDQGLFSDEEEHNVISRRSISFSESGYETGYSFDSRKAGDLDQYLSMYQLPGLTRGEQLALSCLALTIGSTSQSFSDNMHSEPSGQDLDDCGLRFTLELKYQNSISKRSEKVPLQPNDCIWAFHSSCQTELIELIPGFKEKNLSWDELRSVGAGWWVRSGIALKNLIEIVCKTKFQTSKNPIECALFYLAMKKKTLLQSLYRTVRDQKMATFLKHDFTEARWRTAAKKNAFVLLGQQRYEHAAAFFLLADSLEDALEIILKYCEDIQLALVVARLYEEPQNATLGTGTENTMAYNICFKRILSTHILGRPYDSSDATTGSLRTIRYDNDPFICSMAHWWLGEYQSSLYCLLRPVVANSGSQSNHILPHVFSFYCYLYHHPILRRCKDPVKLPFDLPDGTENNATEVISLERRMIFITAYTQFNMGCPSLSLDVLKHLESGFTKLSDIPDDSTTDAGDTSEISTGILTTDMNSLSITSAAPSQPDMFSTPSKAADLNDNSWMTMGAPVASSRFNLDEEYEIDFSSSDSDSSEDEAPTPSASLDPVSTTAVQLSDIIVDNTSECNDEPEEKLPTDPFIVQFRLKCCIKILADELRFLPHALLDQFDPELGPFGGRAILRAKIEAGQESNRSPTHLQPPTLFPGANQLGLKVCQWLKNEIDTIASVCKLKFSDVVLVDLDETVEDDITVLAEAEQFTYQLEESILTVLLLFCILHGDLDYNLAALRLELLFLLQEFHSTRNMTALITSMETESSAVNLPPILTTTAPPPLLLSPLNMLWQLTGHTLKLINRCSVHHNVSQPEIQILNSLSLSASACMWQCLALRHGSARIPNSYAIVKHQPLNWPGLSGNSVYFLVSAGKAFLVNKEKEGAQRIAIVLIEAIISVYLGLFLHALSNSDATLITQLLHNAPSLDMWTKVTGTTVQSVDTNSPRPPKKRVAMMGERIRVKGPRLSQESVVTVRETFLPPSMSLVEFFKREQYVDTSNMFEVDSDCEETLDDDGDDSEDFSSYSWYLMRLMSVIFVQDKIISFLTDIGITFADLAGMSPLLASSMKTLDGWSENLLEQLEGAYPEGCPPDLLPPLLPGSSLQQSLADPNCSPFRQHTQTSLQARILWHKLANETPVSEYLQTKEPEVIEGDSSAHGVRTAFSGTEGVSSFSCYQNRINMMVVTTLREILEIDVKTCMDRDRGVKEEGNEEGSNTPFVIISNDDNKPKKNHLLSDQSTISSESNVEVFNQILKRQESGVRCSTSHSELPLYLTGNTDGYVKLWEFGYPHHLAKYGLSGTRGRVTSVRFGPLGAKFGLSDTNGAIGLWHTTVSSLTPYCVLNCHDRATRDFAFLGSASVLASVGSSSNNRNVVIWDTLLPPSECAVKKFQAHEMGAMVCCYSPKSQVLISAGSKGDVCIFDVRQRKLQHMFTAHDSAVRSMCLSPDEEIYFTGSAEGDIKSWSLGGAGGDQHSYSFSEGHKSTKLFSNLPGGSLKGVMKLYVDSTNHLVSCGADGEVKIRLLSNK